MAFLDQFTGIIFDYGGVLAYHQTDADQRKLAQLAGIPFDAFADLYWAARHDYDKDLLSATDYWQGMGDALGLKFTSQQIAELTNADSASWMNYDPIMWQWIAELRANGKRVAILSNMPRDLGQALRSQSDRFSYFDHETLSYELKSAKPEPFIYGHCLAGIGTPPAQTLFLDDRIVNIRAAEELGIAAVQFTSRDAVLPKLRA